LLFRNKRARHPFESVLAEIRSRVRPEPFDWYRFDSFANLAPIADMFPGGLDSLVELARGEPVADIGAADGDLAFLLESLGLDVTIIDWPGTNINRMHGAELLKRELRSSVAIGKIDIDSQFQMDGDRFGLVLALGVLYHLKNPFFFLERLAYHSRYCLLSTRILPRGQTRDAVAYLTREGEFENDPTNFWFFSEAGVERLADRCGWDITRKTVTGDGADDRFFCLAESRIAKTAATIRLVHGWHEIENGAWRWTGRDFAAVIDNAAGTTRLEFRFQIMPELLDAASPVTLRAEIDGEPLPSAQYDTPGVHVYSLPVPAALARAEIRFRLSHSFSAGGRDLGVIVTLPPRTIVDDDCGIRLTGGNHR
jgi:2-polyprenyl-3-methyl-5-hydroxy-6-metoxy-1,4-benzoquinol methylase